MGGQLGMRIPILQVDAFARRRFTGNPAAICPLDAWLDDELLQAIAAENNLSETAFLVPAEPDDDVDYHLRWFTPAVEVDLCGHATLAAGYVVFKHLRSDLTMVRFATRSGPLAVARTRSGLAMDLPLEWPQDTETPEGVIAALGARPDLVLSGKRDWLAVYGDEAAIVGLSPDFRALAAFKGRGVIATAPGKQCDFVLRYFAPSLGIDEDPVTGSAYTLAGPYWAQTLNRTRLSAQQISQRGGDLTMAMDSERIQIEGRCVEVLAGELILD